MSFKESVQHRNHDPGCCTMHRFARGNDELNILHIPYKRNAIPYKRHFFYVIDRFDSVPLCLSHISGISYKRNALYYCFRIILFSLNTKLRKLLSNWILFFLKGEISHSRSQGCPESAQHYV